MTPRPARRALARILRAGAALSTAALLAEAATVASFFATAPTARPNPRGELSPSTSAAVTLVALSDVHGRPGVLRAALDRAREDGAAAVLLGGDLADRNGDFEYRWGASLLADAPVPVFLAIGNHEGYDRAGNLSRERFERFFGPPVSWISARGVLVVSIDTADESTFSEEQARVVDAILAAERPRALGAVILTHVMPLFATPSIDKRGFVKHLDAESSRRLRALCARHRVGLVLGGHFHGYATETRDGTTYVMSGGGGGALDGRDERYHFLRVTFRDGAFAHEMIQVADHHGTVWLRYLALRNRVTLLAALGGTTAALLGAAIVLGTRRDLP